MTAALVLNNLVAWSAQVCLLVAVGALAATTLSHPRARLIFWQGILAIALLLPVLEPWHQPVAADAGSVSIAATAVPVIVAHHAPFRFAWKREYLLSIAAFGAALRFLWIGIGLFRLRRHRLEAKMLATAPVPFSNPRVRWFVSTTVGGPVTFGILNPSILLPARILAFPQDMTAAIAHHELEHVRRHDWLFVLFEEAVRSALWFHPAVWFLLSRIQLAREQVVDAEVVGLTRDRERYLDALVAVAAHRLLPDVAPAPLFLKKRQLAVRVAAVLKETRMSKPRTFLSYTTVCSAAFLAARLAVWMFPLQAPAQDAVAQAMTGKASIVADGPGVVVEPGAKILHRSPVFVPPGVTTAGTVIVESTVNAKGEVTDAHVTSGPEELRNAALSSILNWHFSTDGGLPPTVQSTIRFEPAPHPASVAAAVGRVTPAPSAAHTPLYVKSIDMIGLSDELEEKVRAGLPVHVGDAFGNDDLARVQSAVKEIDEHLLTGVRNRPPDVMLTIMLRPPMMTMSSGALAPPVPAPFPQAASDAAPATPQRIRVGGNVQAANLIRKVTPVYPPLAKQARIQGSVRFTVLIGKDGSVVNLQLVEGHPLLVESARDAVAQWMYKPTLLNGEPVEVITQVDVNYTLTQ